MLELKLAGNHLDRKAVERALLRRQARQVQRLEDLPLVDELVPFLLARSGQALDDFDRWVAPAGRPSGC
jgi:hypothetical protein